MLLLLARAQPALSLQPVEDPFCGLQPGTIKVYTNCWNRYAEPPLFGHEVDLAIVQYARGENLSRGRAEHLVSAVDHLQGPHRYDARAAQGLAPHKA